MKIKESMSEEKLTNSDQWFAANLTCVLGGEIALVNKGHQNQINRESIAEWVVKNSEYTEQLRTELAAVKLERDELKRKLSAEERDCLHVIAERDNCEEVINNLYLLIAGYSPEWSTHYGYPEALEDCELELNNLRSSLDAARRIH